MQRWTNIDKPVIRLRKKVLKIRNKKSNIISDATEIQWIIWHYYEQVHTNKLDSNGFLSINIQPTKTEETENFNQSVSGKGIEPVVRNLLIMKNLGQDVFSGELCQTFIKNYIFPSQNLPKNWWGRITFKFILKTQNYLDTKARGRYYNETRTVNQTKPNQTLHCPWWV